MFYTVVLEQSKSSASFCLDPTCLLAKASSAPRLGNDRLVFATVSPIIRWRMRNQQTRNKRAKSGVAKNKAKTLLYSLVGWKKDEVFKAGLSPLIQPVTILSMPQE